ncbi:hypothetical protein [Paenibacillus turpanensis]|uniref:hypothetical protein n=1 Tax=Paenibacillus turpanensis TaxID=2689078 RepID=UPI00140CE0C6|nr:hypothetical protein [Paenibacillus turpanensis]
MSLPTIPPITPPPQISKETALSLVIVSIALEEIGLSHIINAEGEKIQKAVSLAHSVDELVTVNESVNDTLKTTLKKEMLLDMKLSEAIEAYDSYDPRKGRC